MSDSPAGEGMVLNWRGPLLAATVFALVFAVLLLMAHQNETNTSDMGSSLRQDPYGTSLLFDAYERAGYQVERSQDEDSLGDENAARTTAFFIGGFPDDGWQMANGNLQSGGKFRKRLEDFLARGGRVVLVEPSWVMDSKSQGWTVENKWSRGSHPSGPAWAAADRRSMPPGSEMMYLGADAPWLKTDSHWTALYAGPVNPPGTPAPAAKDDRASPEHVYMAMRPVAKGELIAASQESFLLNEAIKTRPNPVLLDFLAGGRPAIWVDETLHGLHQEQGVLWLIQRYRLQTALLLFWAALLALLWSFSGDLVRRPARGWNDEIVRNGERAGLAGQRLLQRSVAKEHVVSECWNQFRRRSPQDAQAISADSRCGPRLRAALAQSPLEGYRELLDLIAERRTSAMARVTAGNDAPKENTASPKTASKEVTIA
jgi:hypothetical protein